VISLALGGTRFTTTVEGRERYPVRSAMPGFRDDPTKISRLLAAADGTARRCARAGAEFIQPSRDHRGEGGYLTRKVVDSTCAGGM